MNRRRFITLLAALPFVGKLAAARSATLLDKVKGASYKADNLGRFSVSRDPWRPNFEWICGPFATQTSINPNGVGKSIVCYGQVRNIRNGRTANWAKQVDEMSAVQRLADWVDRYPRASDWSPEFRHVDADRDTINDPPSDFEKGLLVQGAAEHRLTNA